MKPQSGAQILDSISKTSLILIKKNTEFNELKKRYLNYSKVAEFLFNKPTKKKIITDYDNSVKNVYLDPDSMPFLEFGLNRLLDILFGYGRYLRKYLDLIKEYTKITNDKPLFPKIRYLPVYTQLSGKEREIINILERIKNKYKLDYVFKWNFVTEGERFSVVEKIPINFSNDFVYDFFGQIIYDDRLILFVIEYKDDIDEKDFIKQHILFQMNIHLLRLNQKSNLVTEIKKFFSKISMTDEYVIKNKIIFDPDSLNELDELTNFIKEYQDNHMAYLKNPKKKDLERNETMEISEEPIEEKTVVKKDLLKKLVDKKIHFTVEDTFDENDTKIMDEVWEDRRKEKDNDIINMVVELVKK